MAQRVVIKNFEVEKFLGNLLATHSVAARYTSIVHLFKKEDTLVSQKYIWAHALAMRGMFLFSILLRQKEGQSERKHRKVYGLHGLQGVQAQRGQVHGNHRIRPAFRPGEG
jgi:hypothetical protein